MRESLDNDFRKRFRSEKIGNAYSGRAHFWFTTVTSLAAVAFCLLQADRVQPLEWLAIPATFLYANLVEYWGHRRPMHHPTRGLKLIYQRHSKEHHRFFTHDRMQFDSPQDYKAVLFPPIMIVFFIGGFGVSLWFVLAMLISNNVAWLALATGIAYFLNYEWLHFAYHCPANSAIGRLPGMKTLRRLHQNHHNPGLMMRYNFNITYPIGDWLFGTLYRSERN